MCGINGIFAYHYASRPVDREELRRTRDAMTARGPDGAGDWISADQHLGFGHRRLAIIDLSEGGAQPMASPDGHLVVTFNGEIYNYRTIRTRLEAKGYRFRTGSDTEVLLHLYAERGAEMVHELRGMYAFAIWDAASRELLLARDPMGIKPLYYADDGWTFRFASQVKALAAGGALDDDPDPAGIVSFFLWGSVREPHTTLRSVRALPAGCTMRVDRLGAHTPERYHSVAGTYIAAERAPPPAGPALERLRDTMLDTVRHHLVADVPVGLFLSGGMDSAALAGLLHDVGAAERPSLTLAFEEFRGTGDDESPIAAEVAEAYGAHHEICVVTRSEFEADLPRILAAMDQPSIDGVNSWFISKAAAARGLKVALSGLGGDELLGGYPSFRDIPRWVERGAFLSRVPGLGMVVQAAMTSRMFEGLNVNPKAAGLLRYGGTYPGAYFLRRGLFMPWDLTALLPPDFVAEGLRRLGSCGGADQRDEPAPSTPFARIATLETTNYMRNQLLRDMDWASMAHGLEVRVPYVDATVVERLAPLTVHNLLGNGKEALATVPRDPLPASVTAHPKTGFSTPVARWQEVLTEGGNADASPVESRRNPWARRWARRVATATLPSLSRTT